MNHSEDDDVRVVDIVITANTVEGFFSIFKRGMRGVYQDYGEQHPQRYLREFDFRDSHPSPTASMTPSALRRPLLASSSSA